MQDLIKETVDAVRLAEKEAESIITTAKENAQDKKNQVKSEAESYKAKALETAQVEAEDNMKSTIRKCEEYNERKLKEIEGKIERLKSEASKNFDGAVDAVINALV